MNKKILLSALWLSMGLLLCVTPLHARELRVAVASNFAKPMTAICKAFDEKTGHKTILMFGSTGKHFAQIKNGAPVDLFFAADIHRPLLLEKEGIGLLGTRFTYATGKIILWSPDPSLIDVQGNVLKSRNFHFLAIANPKFAPYGQAAEQVIKAMGAWNDTFKSRLVRGENISQTFQYVKSGNAQLGFVAASQILNENGSRWVIPQHMYTPIAQQAIIIQKSDAALSLMDFFNLKKTRTIIRRFGYDI